MAQLSVLKARLIARAGDIHSPLAGELLSEGGMSPLQFSRRFAMAKVLDVARPATMNDVEFCKTLGRYRERVGFEISKASEYGARWWSRRLVEVCEEAGLLRHGK